MRTRVGAAAPLSTALVFNACSPRSRWTMLADQDGIYDPNDTNDRLVLGLKGTMSEVELSTMRNRLERGKLHKAERGELILTVPCGYLKLPHGEVILDPDEQVRSTVQLIFDKFAELGSFGKV